MHTYTHTLITRHVLFKETQVQVSICCESDGSGPTCCLLITRFPHLHLSSLTASQPLSSTAASQSSNPPQATTNPNPYYSSHLFSPTFLFDFYSFMSPLNFLKNLLKRLQKPLCIGLSLLTLPKIYVPRKHKYPVIGIY